MVLAWLVFHKKELQIAKAFTNGEHIVTSYDLENLFT